MMNNLLSHSAFSMTALTAAINTLPINFGRTESLNLFPSKSVTLRSIAIEEQNGVLSLLPTQSPGAPATVGKRGKRKVRTFTIPHIPHDDVVLPEEVQGIRAFGSESELTALANVITDHLELMRDKHSITLEHLRMGALKGIILDADGSELLNLYTAFDITPKVVNFALGTATTDIKKKCLEVLRHIEDNLSGEYMTGVHALVSPEFKEIPAIQTCETYPVMNRSIKAPAVFVELESLEPGIDPGTEELALKGRFEARIVIDSTIKNAFLIVRSLAIEVARVVNRNTWGINVSPAELLLVERDELKPELNAYLVWLVEWEHEMHIGESVWVENDIQPHTLNVGEISVGK